MQRTTIKLKKAKTGKSPIAIVGMPGIGNVGFLRCNCENVAFDVDEFGRTFFPDLSLFKVRVIDTAGNAVASFGKRLERDDG